MKLETIIVKMAYLEPIMPLGEILSTIETIEKNYRAACRETMKRRYRNLLQRRAHPAGCALPGRRTAFPENARMKIIVRPTMRLI